MKVLVYEISPGVHATVAIAPGVSVDDAAHLSIPQGMAYKELEVSEKDTSVPVNANAPMKTSLGRSAVATKQPMVGGPRK